MADAMPTPCDTRLTLLVALGIAALAPRAAAADEPAPPAAARPPYSVPLQLRPVAAVNVVRLDTAIAMYEDAAGAAGNTQASLFLASYKLGPSLAPFVRLAVVHDAPAGRDGATAVTNPALGVIYARPLGQLKSAYTLGLALPIGMGGGDDPDPATAAASASGVLARSSLDNAMFAVNDLVIFPGAAVAWVERGLTVQVEVTVFELIRLRGKGVQPDSSKTNLTTGLHVGYFVVPGLSLAAELRHQRWLTSPAFVDADGSRRETTTVALGARGHLEVAGTWFRPALAYARGLDDPMASLHYHVVQLDLPFYF
jgi:hypothetical protein